MIFILIMNPGLIYLNIFVFWDRHLPSTLSILKVFKTLGFHFQMKFTFEIGIKCFELANQLEVRFLEPICQGISSCFFVVHFTSIFQYFSWVIRISPVTFHPKLKYPLIPKHLNDKTFYVQSLKFMFGLFVSNGIRL